MISNMQLYEITTDRMAKRPRGMILEEGLTARALYAQGEAIKVKLLDGKYVRMAKRYKKIGIKTKNIICDSINSSASDRIRGRWLAENHKDIEMWGEDTVYSAIIFHAYDIAEWRARHYPDTWVAASWNKLPNSARSVAINKAVREFNARERGKSSRVPQHLLDKLGIGDEEYDEED